MFVVLVCGRSRQTHRRLVLLEGKRSVYRYTLHSSLNRSPTA
jgi:hypothetical protein